jgi:diguanylate cyclase (GGDEF)-like protein
MRDGDDDLWSDAGSAARLVADPLLVNELLTEIDRLKSLVAEQEKRILDLTSVTREDDLTGLLNRRGLHAELDRVIAFVDRYQFNAALLYLDIDGFKGINDRYGHAIGDRILTTVAQRAKSLLRSSDAIGRIGGDEFIAVLWRVDLAAARAKAEIITAALEHETLTVDGEDLKLRISVGAALFRPGDTADAVITRADRDMYRIKQARKAAAS